MMVDMACGWAMFVGMALMAQVIVKAGSKMSLWLRSGGETGAVRRRLYGRLRWVGGRLFALWATVSAHGRELIDGGWRRIGTWSVLPKGGVGECRTALVTFGRCWSW